MASESEGQYGSPAVPRAERILNRLLAGRNLAITIVSAAVFFCVPHAMRDPDIWWHLRNAEWQLHRHAFLRQDMFSFTAAGAPWIDHEWLAELPFYAAYRVLGERGLYAVTLLLIEIIFLCLLLLTYKKTRSHGAAVVTTCVGILLSTVSFGPRTLLFGWMFLLLELLILAYADKREGVLWVLPGVFLLWVNTHGSWMIGMIVLLFYTVSRCLRIQSGYVESEVAGASRQRKLYAVVGASLAAVLVNPYGWRLVAYPFDLAFRQKLNVASVDEWRSLDFHSPRGKCFLLSLGMLLVCQWLRPRRWEVFELITVCIGIYAGVTYSRFLFLAAILVMPSLAVSLASCVRMDGCTVSPRVRAACVFLLGCILTGAVREHRVQAAAQAEPVSAGALAALAESHDHGRVFNQFELGGYLLWRAPDVPVFIDSRVDIFERNGTFRDYLDVLQLKDAAKLLKRDRIQYVLFTQGAPLVELLEASGEWSVRYEDRATVLLQRMNDEERGEQSVDMPL